jgi:LytS/YehU family sensor histidine kinase
LLLIYPLRDLLHFEERFESFSTSLHSAFFFATLIYVSVTSLLKFIKDWLKLQDLNLKIAKVEQQKLEAELKTLKGQLNPHFLFNSLNNIYSLSLIKSDNVPDLILKLSDLMRHIIYESGENFISLEKELDFVDNFITLQKIRTPSNVQIKYEIKGQVPDAKIAPLLFEPFIDNAFKHGLPATVEKDFILITFDLREQDVLKFHIENNFEEHVNWNNKNSGIGIYNVKQRLNYLYKSSEYNLVIKKENSIFSVSLQLILK